MNITLWMDRLVSSSAASDVREALRKLVEAATDYPNQVWTELVANSSHDDDNDSILGALLQIMRTGSYKDVNLSNSSGNEDDDDEGPSLVAQLYKLLLSYSSKQDKQQQQQQAVFLLQHPRDGLLLEALVDVASSSSNDDDNANRNNNEPTTRQYSTYTRVLCLQSLHIIAQHFSRIATTQLLQAPNGLHRLGDLLASSDEQVRNEALLLAAVIATWPSAAKVWMFESVGDAVMELAMQEGGLTGGNVIVQDALHIVHNMVSHDATKAAHLVWESAVIPKYLRTIWMLC
jgi:hypothetical protein